LHIHGGSYKNNAPHRKIIISVAFTTPSPVGIEGQTDQRVQGELKLFLFDLLKVECKRTSRGKHMISVRSSLFSKISSRLVMGWIVAKQQGETKRARTYDVSMPNFGKMVH
jgi:hypothetical protein